MFNYLLKYIIAFAPYGVFGLMAWVSASYGIDVLLSLGKVILGVYVGCIIHVLLTMGGTLTFIAKLNPLKFYKGIISAQSVAFTTTSSSGTGAGLIMIFYM
nr:cation:dicarboxylase symporter family transporter [Sulfurospirillum arcachonense]